MITRATSKAHNQMATALILFFVMVQLSAKAQWTYETANTNNIYNTNTGNVGIGVTAPTALLHIASNGFPSLSVGITGNLANSVTQLYNSMDVVAASTSATATNGVVAHDFYNNGTSSSWSGTLMQYFGTAVTGTQYGAGASNLGVLLFENESNGVIATNGSNNIYISPNSALNATFYSNGTVGIGIPYGSTTQGYELAVNGSAIFTQAVVKLYANWPDYVFQPDYKLPSLRHVAQYIQTNHHLPDMPSADSLSKTGLDLGVNQAALLKKIEELTLYIIEQDKELGDQNKTKEELDKKLSDQALELGAQSQKLKEQDRQLQELKERLLKLEEQKGK